jgi:hypothetical protein
MSLSKVFTAVFGAGVIVILAFLFLKKSTSPVNTTLENENVHLSSPLANSFVASPLTIKGEARGNWYFEASFPVRLYDANGTELLAVPVMAKGDWMTTDFVPFETTLTFSKPVTDTGTLVLEKDNPSGLPEHADSVTIPVRFK